MEYQEQDAPVEVTPTKLPRAEFAPTEVEETSTEAPTEETFGQDAPVDDMSHVSFHPHASGDAFKGEWLDGGGQVSTIADGLLCWPNGERVPMKMHAHGFYVEYQCETFTADLVNGRLAWNDGDSWARVGALTADISVARPAYHGEWLDTAGCIATIADGILSCPNGDLIAISGSLDGFSMEYRGGTCAAAYANDCLEWDDGDTWNRVRRIETEQILQSAVFDGEWLDRNGETCTIANGLLSWTADARFPIKQTSDNGIYMIYQGEALTATCIDHGQLKWSDGDVWDRSAPRELPGDASLLIEESSPREDLITNAEPFDGVWLDATGQACTIKEGRLTWSNGDVLALTALATDASGFQMTCSDKQFTAHHVHHSRLEWDDGDVWERVDDEADEVDETSYNN